MWQPIERLNAEVTHKHILTQLKGYVEREEVAALTNCDIAVPREQLPTLEDGEHYWHELINMQVVNVQGELLGEVAELMMTGSNDVLVVKGPQRYLIPYLPQEVIVRVDKEQRTITVDWDVNF